jgi:hypothetical protein
LESAGRGGSESRMIDKTRERAIAQEIANEIRLVLGQVMPEDLGNKNQDLVCGIFAGAFDRHRVVDEAAGARILSYVPGILAKLNFNFAELNRRLDVAVAATVHSGR